ncbi:hypothetical protein M422DRAFT_251682 [Sphaerobolus stellatus SS14]|uniref:Peptidase A1 domain-containing protein n=1 Tax=Sphaerobolus stellatus (strain SS14) TaxID=990650 RepID=A0A0C9UQ44_SPHS4|nr:hypothetical protein M422DRAFT_251682 [Sphaerobolus stellatus SS14]
MRMVTLVLLFPVVLAVIPPIARITESLITLPIAKRIRTAGIASFVEADRARARALIQSAKAKAKIRNGTGTGNLDPRSIVGNVPITNQLIEYTASVGVGDPATQGSSNTWVGATNKYIKTVTSIQTTQNVSVTYGSGSFRGVEFLDRVTLSAALVINNQSIGVASTSIGFGGVDGILGLGPTGLTLGTLSPATTSLIPTVTDNLFAQGTIPIPLVAISFEPTNTQTITNGELTFGGTDSSKFIAPITFVPITNTAPSNEFWGIQQSISYGTGISILSTTAGIVDTGTTLLLIATNAFKAYQKATGAVPDTTTGLLRLTTAQFANLQSLFFIIGGITFEFTANAQAWPRNLNADIGGNANSVYLIVADIGTNSGQGFDFVNGMVFLERFYSVFDTQNKRVGIAQTPFTFATTN